MRAYMRHVLFVGSTSSSTNMLLLYEFLILGYRRERRAASVKRIIFLSLNTRCSSTVYQTSCFGSPNRDGGKIIVIILDKVYVTRLSYVYYSVLTVSRPATCTSADVERIFSLVVINIKYAFHQSSPSGIIRSYGLDKPTAYVLNVHFVPFITCMIRVTPLHNT